MVAAVAVVDLALDTIRGFFTSWRVADLAAEVSILNLLASIMEIALDVVRIFGQGTTASRERNDQVKSPNGNVVETEPRKMEVLYWHSSTSSKRRLGCTHIRVLRVVTLVVTKTSQEMVPAPRSGQMNHTH